LGIKSKDALHLACAIEGRAKYFITTDKKILEKMKETSRIIVINPVHFVLNMELKDDYR